MHIDILAYIAAALITGASGFYTVYASNQNRKRDLAIQAQIEGHKEKAEEARVDGEAYTRAQQINREIVEDQDKQLAAVRKALREANERTDLLERRVNYLASRVYKLTRLLEENDIEVPAEVAT